MPAGGSPSWQTEMFPVVVPVEAVHLEVVLSGEKAGQRRLPRVWTAADPQDMRELLRQIFHGPDPARGPTKRTVFPGRRRWSRIEVFQIWRIGLVWLVIASDSGPLGTFRTVMREPVRSTGSGAWRRRLRLVAVTVVLLLLLLVAATRAGELAGQGPRAGLETLSAAASQSVGQTVSGGIGDRATGEGATARPDADSPDQGCGEESDEALASVMRVCPGRGAVGTLVVLEGRNCVLPGLERVSIGFRAEVGASGRVTGTFGVMSPSRRTAVRDDGSFRLELRVPERLGPRQGHGGGPTAPGRYEFHTTPPQCSVPFEVTEYAGTK